MQPSISVRHSAVSLARAAAGCSAAWRCSQHTPVSRLLLASPTQARAHSHSHNAHSGLQHPHEPHAHAPTPKPAAEYPGPKPLSGSHSHDAGAHGHSHSFRMPQNSSPELKRAATAVIHVGMLADVSLAVVKGGAGAMTGSSALVSDAVHSLSDMLISSVALLSTSLSRAPPDRNHPYGHGRFDSLGALAVSTLLAFTSGSIGWHGLEQTSRVLHGLPLQPMIAFAEEAAGGASHLLTDPFYAGIAMSVSLGAMGIKEAIYRWNMRVGMAQRSTTLIANAWHHRADSLSSLVAAVGIGGVWAGVPILDPLASLGIAAMIFKAGAETGWAAVLELADQRLDDEILAEAEELALSTPNVQSIRRLRARRQGPSVLLDCEIGVPPSLSVGEAHATAGALRKRIFAARPEVSDVVLVTYPWCAAVSAWQPATAHDAVAHPPFARAMGGVVPSVSAASPTAPVGGVTPTAAGHALGAGHHAAPEAAKTYPGSTDVAPPSINSRPRSATSASAAAAAVRGDSETEAGVRRLLLHSSGARAVTQLVVSHREGGLLDVEAALLFDLNAPLRDAAAALRRARKALLAPPPEADAAAAAAGRATVATCKLRLEVDPV